MLIGLWLGIETDKVWQGWKEETENLVDIGKSVIIFLASRLAF